MTPTITPTAKKKSHILNYGVPLGTPKYKAKTVTPDQLFQELLKLDRAQEFLAQGVTDKEHLLFGAANTLLDREFSEPNGRYYHKWEINYENIIVDGDLTTSSIAPGYSNHEQLGIRTIKSINLTCLVFRTGGDADMGVILIAYLDENMKPRLYLPLLGNTINLDEKMPIGNEWDELLTERYCRQYGLTYDDMDGSADANWRAIRTDIKHAIQVVP